MTVICIKKGACCLGTLPAQNTTGVEEERNNGGVVFCSACNDKSAELYLSDHYLLFIQDFKMNYNRAVLFLFLYVSVVL